MRALGVVLLSSVLASLTDWLFMDVLIHRFYARDPAVWRAGEGSRRIVLSQVIGTLASAAVIVLCWLAPGRPLLVACLVWCAGPLPAILQYLQWVRMAPQVAAGHAAGWLARLLIATECARWLL